MRAYRFGIVTALALLLGSSVSVVAQEERPVRIGVIGDHGVYSALSGMGSVIAARMAVEDFGGEVLGRPIEVVFADHQSKPDAASTIARDWIDGEGIDAFTDGSSSSAALAINEIARNNDKAFLVTGAGSPNFYGEACSPITTHWVFDTYSLANAAAKALVQQKLDTWYFLTADYNYGQSLQDNMGSFVEAEGGKIIGSVLHPLNSQDFSSYLLQAQASGAKAIGFANAGTDFVTATKQAAEFGIIQGGQQIVALSAMTPDIYALGLRNAQGLVVTASFYWDLNEESREWSKRFMERHDGKAPTQIHAGTYVAVTHYLKAVQEIGSTGGAEVTAKMKETPINDFYNKDVKIREDGRVLQNMHVFRVKSPEESSEDWDIYSEVMEIEGDKAYRPMADGNCPMVAKK